MIIIAMLIMIMMILMNVRIHIITYIYNRGMRRDFRQRGCTGSSYESLTTKGCIGKLPVPAALQPVCLKSYMMCVYMYIYIYMYLFICLYIYIYMYILTYIQWPL